MAELTNQYEAMFLFGPAATQDLDGAIKTARSMVERHGGEVLVIKKWDERKLAYEINKQKRGTYVICYFKATGAAVGPIERDVKLSDDVLRVLIVRADHMNADEMAAVEPQPIQPREERNPWDRPYGEDRPRRDDRPRDDRPRDERPREDRPARGPRREEPAATE
jgi:small subunit ribosomal protein S6